MHLVDISCDENHEHSYAPYWAKRGDFQLDPTKSMYADYGIRAFLWFIRDVNLDRAHTASLAITIYGDADDIDGYRGSFTTFCITLKSLLQNSYLSWDTCGYSYCP